MHISKILLLFNQHIKNLVSLAFLRNAIYANEMSLLQIAPSILSADFGRLHEEVKQLEEAGADAIHVDIMDGHFVPNLTFGPLGVKAIRKATTLPLYVHLMIEQPERWVEAYAEAGASLIHVHAEACLHLHRVIEQVQKTGIQVGVALNPATPLSVLCYILHELDQVLIMSVNPGFSGQQFLPLVLPKIRRLQKQIQKQALSTKIEVDGGIKVDNIALVVQAGAQVIVSGSGVFSSTNYRKNIEELRAQIK